MTAVWKSTGPQKGNLDRLRQFENSLHNGKRLIVVRKQWGRDSAHFPLIAVTGYRSDAVRRVEQ